ncbi:unnamed protein product [Tuber aestivum]|uniref:Uncharacterized protein n=1 Tax=Tuber aestivum TaxID=59557 RepID=A0A292PLM6_9PEZI|nr:unnamed protein product [Tuber aestivum]
MPPAAELDDRRLQVHSFPGSGTTSSNARDTHSLIHTDYEQAMLDDDTRDDRSAISPDDCGDRQYGLPFPSRASSWVASSRSPSPQNSAEAFPNPEQRRREDRSTTLSSSRGSALVLRRAISRRPTFTEDQTAAKGSSDEALTTAEEEVCFWTPDESKIGGGNDFEERYEFVADQSRAKPCERWKIGTCGDIIGSRYFDQIKAKDDLSAAPGSVGKEAPISSTSPTNNENAEFWNTPTTPRHRRGDAMIHAPEIGDLPRDGETLHELFRGRQGVWWLDCYDSTAEGLAMLMKAFAIHPVTFEDIWVQETREKVELFRSYHFVCFRSFVQNKNSSDFLDPVNVYTIVFSEGVLSFRFAPSPHSTNVRKLISQPRNYVAFSSDWICYALM